MSSDGVARKFRETVKRWNLFDGSDTVLVAVSGGIDSVVLLHVILHLPPDERPLVRVAHFNHRLRGRGSDAEERFVKELGRKWKVPCHTARARPWGNRSNLEARARSLRYRFLEKTARKFGIRKIVTAHHADDQAETFLIRWLQGAGLKGLGGMGLSRKAAGDLDILRPLLLTRRAEIGRYARDHRIAYREDPTNRSDLFLRGRIRRLLAGIKKENPNLGVRTSTNSIFLRADESFLDLIAREIFGRISERGRRRVRVGLIPYCSLPDAVRYRILQKIARGLRSDDYALPAEAVLKADEILRDSGAPKHYDLPSGLGLNKRREWFEMFRKPWLIR